MKNRIGTWGALDAKGILSRVAVGTAAHGEMLQDRWYDVAYLLASTLCVHGYRRIIAAVHFERQPAALRPRSMPSWSFGAR
jgi:hypothetical protein